MKKLFVSILAFAALTFSAAAQEKKEMKDHKGHKGEMRHHGKFGDKGMMKDLDLNETQKTQLKAIHEEFRTKMEALKNQNLSVQETNERRAALQKERKAKMEALLTPEQKRKIEERKAQRQVNNQQMMQKKLDEMKTKLSLTDDQVTKLKAHQQSTKAKMMAIKQNDALSQADRKQQMKALKEASKTERKSILTAEQLQKFEEMKKDFKKEKKSKNWKQAK